MERRRRRRRGIRRRRRKIEQQRAKRRQRWILHSQPASSSLCMNAASPWSESYLCAQYARAFPGCLCIFYGGMDRSCEGGAGISILVSTVESSFVGLVRGDRGGNGQVLKKSFCFFSFLFFCFRRIGTRWRRALNKDLRVGLLGFKISEKRWFYLRRYSIEIGTWLECEWYLNYGESAVKRSERNVGWSCKRKKEWKVYKCVIKNSF